MPGLVWLYLRTHLVDMTEGQTRHAMCGLNASTYTLPYFRT